MTAGEPGGPDDTGCTVLHVDMDAFYASVELLSRPDLRGRPMIVGGSGNRGVVLSATYEARAYGVRSAMPMSRARRLCSHAVVLPPTFGRYQEASAGVMAVFRDVTPLVEPLSLDEAFLDVGGALRRLGPPARIAAQIKARISAELRLPCTVGVASTKFVAKLASTRGKPDGLLVVPVRDVIGFLHPLPVSALWGVGQRTAEQLDRLGLRTVGDLAHTPVPTLQRSLGQQAGTHLAELAWGRDPRPVVAGESERSIGSEETFERDLGDPARIRRELLRLAERTAGRARAAGVQGRTVVLKIRFADFTTLTRSRTLAEPTDVAQLLYRTVGELYDLLPSRLVRLVGVRLEGLVPAGSQPHQLVLDPDRRSRRDAELAMDRAGARFGSGMVVPATLLEPVDGARPRE
jgi:DNA polymerase-4